LTLHLVVNQDDRASSVLGKNDIQRLLLHRLMVLEAALQRVEELQPIAADRSTP
jgi:signal-transduction protein with cAMP-binding, CBS, and nucleotidyltransferase domain